MRESLLQLVYEQSERLKFKEKWIVREQFQQARNALLHDDRILVITGLRRVGKSTLLQQLMEVADKYCYVNFEDERLLDFRASDFPILQEVLIQVYGESQYYFFDEIQNIPNFESFVRRLQDDGKKVIVTGSNASLLSIEFGTKLTGRYKQIELYPFSYPEFLLWKGISVAEKDMYLPERRAELQAAFKEWLYSGGLPEFLKFGDIDYVKTLYDNLLYRDIIVRYGIRNHQSLKELVHLLVSNVGKPVTYSSLQKTLGLSNSDTVKSYMGYLANAYLFFELPQYFASLKRQIRNPRKVYTIDSAFRQLIGFSSTKDMGRMLENVVYLIFKRSVKEVFFFQNKGECDFIAFDHASQPSVYQVCYELHSENKKREYKGMQEAMDYFDLKSGTLITMNQEEELVLEGKKVKVIPAWKWMLLNNDRNK